MERTEGGLTAYVEDEEAAVGALVALVGVPVQTVRALPPHARRRLLALHRSRDPREHAPEGAVPMFARAHGVRWR